MDIRQLRYFLTLAEEGQITGAARKLHIAQPPLSQQLKQLETELGVKLFERGSRNIRLTEAGELLCNKAEQILKLTEATEKELRDFNKGMVGTLSIGAVSTSGSALLPDGIKIFHDTYPNVKFEIWEGNTFRILEILNSGVIELGIVRTPFNMDNFNSICLDKEPMVAAYTACEMPESITLDKLSDKPIIIYKRFENLLHHTFSSNGINPDIICKTEDARTALLWADSGIGFAIVPRSAVKLIRSSRIKYTELEEPSLITQIAAIWMKNRYLSTAAKNFLKMFINE